LGKSETTEIDEQLIDNELSSTFELQL